MVWLKIWPLRSWKLKNEEDIEMANKKKSNKKRRRFSLNQIQCYWMGVGASYADSDGHISGTNASFLNGHMDNGELDLARKTLNGKKRK